PLGQASVGSPAGQSIFFVAPPAPDSVNVTASVASGRQSITLLLSVRQNLPLCETSTCHKVGLRGTMPAERSALNRPRRTAVGAWLPALASARLKVPGPWKVRFDSAASTTSTSAGCS